jgi:hypothetical protein
MLELVKKRKTITRYLTNKFNLLPIYIARGYLDHSKIHIRNSGGAKNKSTIFGGGEIVVVVANSKS